MTLVRTIVTVTVTTYLYTYLNKEMMTKQILPLTQSLQYCSLTKEVFGNLMELLSLQLPHNECIVQFNMNLDPV